MAARTMGAIGWIAWTLWFSGDFTNALRQLEELDQPATQARLLQLLEAELRFKPGAN